MSVTDNDESLLVTSTSPHIHCGSSVRGIMRDVLLSLVPCCLASVFFFGWRAALLIAVCSATTVATEWGCRKMMKRNNSISDLSAVVTGILLALNLPIGIPLWQAILGSVVSIAVAKQIYGGIGYNPFNPALIGRAFLLISFTATMTTWNPSTWMGVDITNAEHADRIQSETTASGHYGDKVSAKDGTTTATPLGLLKESVKYGKPKPYVYDSKIRWNLFIGNVNGSIGETSKLAILIGFAWLLYRRVITWHTTVSYLGAVAVFALIIEWVSPETAMPVDFHLLAGGALFGAVFMATDMVTSPSTKWGMVIFGIGCGIIMMVIRVVPTGAYPEGVTFAILIMNSLTPLITKLTRYERFGARGKSATKKVSA